MIFKGELVFIAGTAFVNLPAIAASPLYASLSLFPNGSGCFSVVKESDKKILIVLFAIRATAKINKLFFLQPTRGVCLQFIQFENGYNLRSFLD